jgi:undecaprenyl-diphosphatase
VARRAPHAWSEWVIVGTLATGGLALAVFRRWRPVLFLVTVMLGEITLFLVVSTVVSRARPEVKPLNPNRPPTASFSSGHAAGVLCLCLAVALLLVWSTGPAWLRWSAVAVLLPTAVGISRLYRGVHHPTDVLGSVLLAVLWSSRRGGCCDRPRCSQYYPPAHRLQPAQTWSDHKSTLP